MCYHCTTGPLEQCIEHRLIRCPPWWRVKGRRSFRFRFKPNSLCPNTDCTQVTANIRPVSEPPIVINGPETTVIDAVLSGNVDKILIIVMLVVFDSLIYSSLHYLQPMYSPA